jgi:hypothetical protein
MGVRTSSKIYYGAELEMLSLRFFSSLCALVVSPL